MTIHWGYKILILYTGFVAGMLLLVYQCTQQPIDLVAENYYEQELAFQDQINRSNNAATGGMELSVHFDQQQLVIAYPAAAEHLPVSGEIHLFRPDDARLDVRIPVAASDGQQIIDVSHYAKGNWRVQVSWEMGNTPLYQEEKIFIR